MDWQGAWKRWVQRFWFLRGIAAAIAVAQLVPTVTDLSRFEFLQAFHAFLFRWNHFARSLGELVGKWTFLPEVPAESINALLFSTCTAVPFAFLLWRSLDQTAQQLRYSLFVRFLYGFGALNAAVFLLFIAFNVYLGLVDPSGSLGRSFSWMLGPAVLIQFVLALRYLKGFSKGVASLALFIVTLQVLYWLRAPWLADQVRAATVGVDGL